jgi:glutaredoxin 3
MITIYTKENCSSCVRAKNIMKSRGIMFEELKLDEDFTVEEYKATFNGRKTFPLIVMNGVVIGGYDDLRAAIAENEYFGKMILNEGI